MPPSAVCPRCNPKTVEHWTPLDAALAAGNFCTNDTPAPWGMSTTCILPLLIPSHGEQHNSFGLTL
jgi:hypothetical protein